MKSWSKYEYNQKTENAILQALEYSSDKQNSSLCMPSVPLLPNLHQFLCHDPSTLIMTHFTGQGITGKSGHLPPSNSLSKLNHSIGSTFVTCMYFMLCFAVSSDSGLGSKSPYCPRDAILGGSLAR